ncbi:MAG: hypothetical protein GY856_15865, partial [bacterium]|nr:hypothetical protein [bacterium]
TISRTDLSQRTQELVHQVRQGTPAVVHSGGEDQVVLLDALDYRILRGVANWATQVPNSSAEPAAENQVLSTYLNQEISLGRAAELLGLSRFELKARFLRLGVPLRQGPASLTEARAEVEVARRTASTARW